MSLIKQLWIAIAVVTLIALGGSLVVSTLSARHYLQQQLQVKNLDNATSLALSLSQMPKDPVTVELQIAAQFDAGHYRLIRLTSPTGDIVAEREYAGSLDGAPEWFARLVPIEAHAGVAQVQDGWRQFGTLTLESHKRYAYEALWQGTLQLLGWFALGGALTGLVGTLIIKHITRPLGQVVEQAEAIGGRRFVTTPEPSTMEFRSVVRAMNTLSERVRTILAEESRRLEQLRRQTQHDETTGLLNRSQFLNQLDSALARDDAHAAGTLLIARVGDLTGLNQRIGRAPTDRLLRDLAGQLSGFSAGRANWAIGRMNGSDIALLAPGEDDAGALAAALAKTLHAGLDALPDVALPVAATAYAAGETRSQVLARADGALAAAEQAGDRCVRVDDGAKATAPYPDLQAWRAALLSALERDGVHLGAYPVVANDGRLLHEEAPIRLLLDGVWQPAGYFMPRVARLGLMPRFDMAVVHAALRAISADGRERGINVSAESLCDANFRGELFTLLQADTAAAKRLWIEVPEYGALRHLAEFRALCVALQPLGCRVGIEHVGAHFGELGDLHELGLDYMKIDAAVIRGIDANAGNQAFLRGLCMIVHSLGLMAIAEGVESEAESRVLPDLGLDGMTGPAVRAPSAA
ncbi:LapD/MoxY N-terminal periplasmic domain-containing protein [Azoarcus sp. DN11]|uniref:bifunctional diguanylate cyclase/phosphodiesterase n=1 Tax=Azoarcus sp. DN11 TaxID=356837 RepID=UPI000EB12804|nr:LapD/MoxY N-terminal periplasmic domain-containing protein [Azoarcus sp. DN11]AYH45408.1 GGDEF domain-containing protein [Azoarcus sp. DN11]